MELVMKTYPNIVGLADPANWSFVKPVRVPWIQILQNGTNNWMVTYSEKRKTVGIYDTMVTFASINHHVIGGVSSLLCTKFKSCIQNFNYCASVATLAYSHSRMSFLWLAAENLLQSNTTFKKCVFI